MNRCKSCDQKLTDDDFGWLCDSCFTVEAKYHDPQHHQIARRLVFLGVTKTDYSYEEIAAIIAREADLPTPAAPTSARALPAPAMGTPDLASVRELVGFAAAFAALAPVCATANWDALSSKLMEHARKADAALRAAQTEKL